MAVELLLLWDIRVMLLLLQLSLLLLWTWGRYRWCCWYGLRDGEIVFDAVSVIIVLGNC